jgi:hypothetical protein
MKKLNFKGLLKKFTIIDILIIIVIIGAIAFAFIHTGANEEKGESISFDSTTLSKFSEKYLSFYQEGKIVKTHVSGYDATTGKYQELYGTVLWVDDYKGSNVKVLIALDGSSEKPILAGLYKDVKNADFHIEHITLETTGEKYKNLTEIRIHPKNITTLDELSQNIENGTNYTISTTIAIDKKDSTVFQELSNGLFLYGMKESIRPPFESINDQIVLIMAERNEINIASGILGTINGKTNIITIRIYNSTPEEIENIKKAFDVINVKKVT